MDVINKGNLIVRRAFADTDRMATLRRVVNKAMSTAYQMTEEVGDYGSGTPSPLHMTCELIREAYEADCKTRAVAPTARELAEYPLQFYRELTGEVAPAADFIGRFNYMLKSATDANFLLEGRKLTELTPGELREFSRLIMNIQGACGALLVAASEAEQHFDYPGAPVQGERVLRRA